jgi:hypothetical protein
VGKHGSDESLAEYSRLIAGHLKGGFEDFKLDLE